MLRVLYFLHQRKQQKKYVNNLKQSHYYPIIQKYRKHFYTKEQKIEWWIFYQMNDQASANKKSDTGLMDNYTE